jgi:hypothetical protein
MEALKDKGINFNFQILRLKMRRDKSWFSYSNFLPLLDMAATKTNDTKTLLQASDFLRAYIQIPRKKKDEKQRELS